MPLPPMPRPQFEFPPLTQYDSDDEAQDTFRGLCARENGAYISDWDIVFHGSLSHCKPACSFHSGPNYSFPFRFERCDKRERMRVALMSLMCPLSSAAAGILGLKWPEAP